MSKSLLLSVDFDDTIAKTTYPIIHGEVPGAISALKTLHQLGHRIQVWTCRHGEHLQAAKEWLDANEVPYERINENCPALIEQYGETRKMAADIYIDDKMLGGLPPWAVIVRMVEKRASDLACKELEREYEAVPRIVGICGKRGAGKDTVANILSGLAPWGFFQPASFAAKLKKFAQQLTGHQDMFSQEGKATFLPDWGMTAGEILQKLGTDAVRNGLHENAWVLSCFADMKPDEHYIITDCRFPNEVDAIRARGGVIVRVEGDPLGQRGDATRNDEHPSETALDDYKGFDVMLYNTGSLDNLKQQVADFMACLKAPDYFPSKTPVHYVA